MIDWTKPIETVDGRRAKVLSGVMLASDHTRARAVYITPPAGGNFGDVVLVNDNGFRCDDNALLKTEQIIRNAPVKREGWVMKREGWVNIYAVHKTEAAAIQCRSQHEGVVTRFVRWEE